MSRISRLSSQTEVQNFCADERSEGSSTFAEIKPQEFQQNPFESPFAGNPENDTHRIQNEPVFEDIENQSDKSVEFSKI